jgi:hypothetical protein
VLSRGESLELTSDVGIRRYVYDFSEAAIAKLGDVIADAGGVADLHRASRRRAGSWCACAVEAFDVDVLEEQAVPFIIRLVRTAHWVDRGECFGEVVG